MCSDFNEFQTQEMSFVTEPAAEPRTLSGLGPRRYGDMPATDLSRLRSSLYYLKDQINATMSNLQEYGAHLPPEAAETISSITRRIFDVEKAVTVALSNHGSDWLDWGIEGGGRDCGLTHAEFSALEPEAVNDFAERLRQVSEVLEIEHDPQVAATWSRQMITDHRNVMLMEEGQLDVLNDLAAVLSAIFTPRRESPHVPDLY